jgi:hypothetical protein
LTIGENNDRIVSMEFIDLTEKKCFLVKCSDWSTVVEAVGPEEACTISLSKMLSSQGKNLKLSSVIISEELKPDVYSEDYNEDEIVSYHSVSRMLANAGEHELSANVKQVFGA